MRDLPTGTVTFLFTDVEGSTRLIQALGDRFVAVHQEHQRLIRTAIATHDGREVSTEGDSFFVVFEDAASGVAATGQIHRGLAAAAWPSPDAVVRVRAGLHTGQGIRGGDNYLGLDVNRAARISAAGHGGQTLLSDATATAAREGLGTLHAGLALRDLGRHRLRDVGVERLWQLDVEGLPTEFAPLRSLEAHPSNLPAEPTPLVDRGAERAYVRGLLDSAAVVTVTGPGGIGKTRVALAVAHDLLPAMPDGVFHVDAAAIENADRLADELATVAGVRIAPGQDAATALEEHLRTRMVLLVVDTLDRVSGAPAFVARLAAACPGVRLLVTSRSPLHIAAERDVPLEPLPSDAGIALFVDRAAAIRPGFELSAANAAAIAEICARLDGVPLALELAAARLRLLSPDALLARLTSRLGLLTGGTADAPDRQRTLRATIDWSVEALSEGDRRALARLSVFAATFDLDAAEAILGDPEALDALSRLVDQSVVVAVPGDTPRFRLLGSMREFAAEALAALGETEAARRAHADWVGGAVDAATPELEGAGDLDAVARLDAILDELRAALDWLLGPGADPAGALEIAAGLGRFWWLRGRPREGRAWLERTLDALPAGTSGGEAVRADALYWSGVLADEERMPAVAKERLAEALALRRAMGDERGIARTLNSLGAVARSMGQLDQAETLLGESLERKRTLGDGRGMAATLSNLGLVAADRDDLALAHARFEQALALDRASGERGAETYSLLNLGGVKIWTGDVDPGVAIVREALGVLADLDDADGVAEAVEHLALASRARGDLETAARLLFAARQVRARAGAPLREIDARRVDSAFAAVRAALPAELLQSLEAEAAALDEAAAAALALSTVKVAGSAA